MSDVRKVINEVDLIEEAMAVLENKVLVDVGCGAGHMARELTIRGARVIGIDNAEMVQKAEEYKATGNETYRVGAGESIPLESDWADGVIFFASLHHVPVDKMPEALKECYRVLKKNGLAIIVEPVFRAGSWSELVILQNNEEEIQRQALVAIKDATGIGFTQKKEEYFYFDRSFEHYVGQLKDHVSDEKKRAEYIRGGEEILARFSKEAGVAPADYRFKSHCRLNILQKQ